MSDQRRPVLVVDDDAASREGLINILRVEGYPATGAADGEEALEVAEAVHPCLILLDLMMPGMDGFSFREAQLQAPELAGIPVLVMSALRADQIRRRMGPLPAVAKPIEMDELIAQVVALCDLPGASH